MNPDKPYRKHDSFVEIRHGNDNHAYVRSIVAELRTALSLRQRLSDKDLIVLQACNDVLQNAVADDKSPRFSITENAVEEMARLPRELLPRYLYYRYRYDVFPRAMQCDGFPPCVQIEPTSICNYRCVFCYQTDAEFTKKSNGHMGTMSLDLFRRIVDQLDGNCEAVTLASRGDPLICRDILRMLEYCGRRFLALKLNTNAWFLDEEKCHGILASGVQTLVFSADAAAEPLYSRLRVGGRLDHILENVRRFREIRDKYYSDSKLITRVSGVFVDETQDLGEMQQFWGSYVDQVAFVAYNPWENTYERGLSGVSEACSDLWRRLFVWHDGTVNPCDVDYKSKLAVGNARDSSISQLWRSAAYEDLRVRHLERRRSELFPCNRCSVV